MCWRAGPVLIMTEANSWSTVSLGATRTVWNQIVGETHANSRLDFLYNFMHFLLIQVQGER